MSDENVTPDDRAHDQPAEGGRETVEEMLDETGGGAGEGGVEGGGSRADEAGIVDQQDAALEAMDGGEGGAS